MRLHLTGSHFFGTARAGSDVDFYTADSAETRRLLERWQFVPVRCLLAPESNTRAVYWRGDLGLHVQLVHDVELKGRVQRLMRECGLADALRDKQLGKKVWRLAYRLAAEMEAEHGRSSGA